MTFRGIGLPEVGGQATAEGQNSPEAEVEGAEADHSTEEGVDPLRGTQYGRKNTMNGMMHSPQAPDPVKIAKENGRGSPGETKTETLIKREDTEGQKRPTTEETRRGLTAIGDQIAIEDLTVIGGQKRPMTETVIGGQKRLMIETITEMDRRGQKRLINISLKNMRKEREEGRMREREQEVLVPEEGDMKETVAQTMNMREEEEEGEGASPQRKDRERGILVPRDEVDAQGP